MNLEKRIINFVTKDEILKRLDALYAEVNYKLLDRPTHQHLNSAKKEINVKISGLNDII